MAQVNTVTYDPATGQMTSTPGQGTVSPVDVQKVYEAIRAADKAGDTEGVKRLAEYLKSIQGQATPQPAPQPAPQQQPANAPQQTVNGNSSVWDQLRAGAGDIVHGVGDVVGLVGNPLNATINAVTGSHLSTDLGTTLQNATGLPQGTPWISAINRSATNALATGGVAKAASGVASGVAKNALTQFAGTPMANFAAGAGAGAGQEAAKAMGYGPVAQVAGSLVGGGIGAGVAGGINAFNGARSGSVVNPVMQSADRLGIKMLPADVGGTGAQLASAVIRGGTIGEIPMQEGAKQSVASAAAARSNVAGQIGDVASDATGAGQSIIAGIKSFLNRSQTRGNQLEAALPIHPDTPVSLGNTKQTLSDVLSGFESNPQLADIWAKNPKLQATLEALTGTTKNEATGILDASGNPITREVTQGGKLSWQDMRRLRSTIGEIIGQPSLTSDGSDIAALKRVYGALSQDMTDTANSVSPQAATAFSRVNQYWRGRQSRIENVLSNVLGNDGNKSAEAAFQQINRWAQNNGGNFKALAQTMRSLPEDEANTVRATILDRMGNARPGAQNADGNVFSPAEFVTQWNNLSARAKSVLFPDPQHRADVESLAKVMDAMKRAGTYTNHSKTGIIGGGLAAMHALASPLTGIPQLIAEYGAGKLMASPKVARMLAMSYKPGASPTFTNELKNVAARQPAVTTNVPAIQAYMTNAFGQSPVRAAAAPAAQQEQNGGGVPVQY